MTPNRRWLIRSTTPRGEQLAVLLMVSERDESSTIQRCHNPSHTNNIPFFDLTHSSHSRSALDAAMTSNQPISLVTSKSINGSPQLPSPSQSQAPIPPGHESFSQRRSGGSGSFGAGASTRTTTSAGRNGQGFRKQNKAQRRPRLTDEDAAAESVRQVL